MNLRSFVDEIIKVGAIKIGTQKRASAGSEEVTTEAIEVVPSESSSRLPLTAGIQPAVSVGSLGIVGEAKNPIDQPSLNKGFYAGDAG